MPLALVFAEPLSCRMVTNWLNGDLDDTLRSLTGDQVGDHVAGCTSCQGVYQGSQAGTANPTAKR